MQTLQSERSSDRAEVAGAVTSTSRPAVWAPDPAAARRRQQVLLQPLVVSVLPRRAQRARAMGSCSRYSTWLP